MKNVLVTGGLGFIGFNALQTWSTKLPECKFVCYDLETYAAQFMIKEKKAWLKSRHIPTVKADIRDVVALERAVEKYDIDTLVNFAAESHVDNSISGPAVFFQTNVLGTISCLDICRKHHITFHQISTDEVIGTKMPELGQDCTEKAMFDPSSPYAASKAAAELAVLSYVKTYKMNATISRCTNNFGPWQHPEKLIPTVLKNAFAKKHVPIYGDGKQRRFWIFVDVHNAAVLKILQSGKPGNIYNIAPKKECLVRNIDLTMQLLEMAGAGISLIKHVPDRPAHDLCYWLNADKLKTELGFEDTTDFKKALELTVSWYRQNLR